MERFLQIKLHENQISINGDKQAKFGDGNSNARAFWKWDEKTLTVSNDRYGFLPLYYFSSDKEFIVSNSLIKILEIIDRQNFDEESFAVFLRFGYLIGDETIFSKIKIVPANAVLSWENGQLKVDSTAEISIRTAKISRREAIENYAVLFQKAVEKNLPPIKDFAVPVSGGHDSRHILLALDKAKCLPDACLTIIHPPPRPNEDAKIAKLLCDAVGVEHCLIEQNASRFEAEIRKNQLTDLGVYEHGWFLTMADFVKNRWRTVYDGIAGDVLSAGLFLTETRLKLFREGKFSELAEEILGPEGYLPSLLDKKLYRIFSREKAVMRLAKELEKHQDAPNPVGSFFFWNRTRRAVALSPFKLFDDEIDVLTPYLDAEVFDFLASLPAEMFLNQQFHTETIAHAYPRFAEIPYEQKNTAPVFNDTEFRRFSREIFQYSLTKRNFKIINRSFVALRNLRCEFDKTYRRTVAEFGEQAIILMQLERI